MSFKQARKIKNIILGAIMFVSILGMIFQGTLLMAPIFIILAGLFFALMYFTAKYFKCPHCNSGFSLRFPITATHCPFCGEKLE